MAVPSIPHPARKIASFVAHGDAATCGDIGSKSGQLLVTGGGDGIVNVWRVGYASSLRSFDAKKEVTRVLFDRGENRVLAGTAGGAVKLWELESSKQSMAMTTAHRSSVSSLEFHPFRDNIIASGGGEGLIRLWDARTGAEFVRYSGHTSEITCLRFTPHGRVLASASRDGKIIMYDLTAGKPLTEVVAHRGGVASLTFHPTEFMMATSGNDSTIKFWGMDPALRLACTSPSHSNPVVCGQFVPPTTGTAFAAVTCDNLRMWSFPPAMLGEAAAASFKTETMDLVDVPWSGVVSTWVGDSIKSASKPTGGDAASNPLHLMALSLSGASASVWAVNLSQLAPLASRPLHAFSVLAPKADGVMPSAVKVAKPTPSTKKEVVKQPVVDDNSKEAEVESDVKLSDTSPSTDDFDNMMAAMKLQETALENEIKRFTTSTANDSAPKTAREVSVTQPVAAVSKQISSPKKVIVTPPVDVPEEVDIAVNDSDTKDDTGLLTVEKVAAPTDAATAKISAVKAAVSKAQEVAAAVASKALAGVGRKPKAQDTHVEENQSSSPPTEKRSPPAVEKPATDHTKSDITKAAEAVNTANAANGLENEVQRSSSSGKPVVAPQTQRSTADTADGAMNKNNSIPRAVGDFVPATRHEPIGLDFALFLPTNNARGFGMSRVFPGGLVSTASRTGKLMAVEEQVYKAVTGDRGAAMRALAFRHTEIAQATKLWADGDVRSALEAVLSGCQTDPEIGVAFLKNFSIESGALNAELAQLLMHLLLMLLDADLESSPSIVASTVISVLRAFGGFMKNTLELGNASGDLAAEDRYDRASRLLVWLEKLRQRVTGSVAAKNADLERMRNVYEEWRNSLPLQAVAVAARAATTSCG